MTETGGADQADDYDRFALLVERARAGDDSAATELIRANEKKLFRTVLSLTSDFAEAEDICQLALLDAMRNLNKLRDPRAFSPWLLRIARNRAIELMRSKKAREQRDGRWLDAMQMQRMEADLGQTFNETDRRKTIARRIEQLPGIYRAILLMFYWREQSVREISEQLDMPVGTIKSYLKRSRETLRRVLDRELI